MTKKKQASCAVVDELLSMMNKAAEAQDKATRKKAQEEAAETADPDFQLLSLTLPQKNMTNIRELHRAAGTIVGMLDLIAAYKLATDNSYLTEALNKIIVQMNTELEQLELKLQKEWTIKQDVNKHTWWLKPHFCRCPKMDNTDPMYFGLGKIIAGDCPIHGIELQAKLKK